MLHGRAELAAATAALQGVYVDVVDLTGHILVAGHGLQPSALLALLAPLRSTALANAAPLVLLDAAADLEGPEWADAARYGSNIGHAQLHCMIMDLHAFEALNDFWHSTASCAACPVQSLYCPSIGCC